MNIATTVKGAIASPMDVATKTYRKVPISRDYLERTGLFWEVARSEGFIDASALKDVLQRFGYRPPPKTRYAQMMASEVVDATGKVVETTGKTADNTGKAVDVTSIVVDTTGKAVDTTGKVLDATGEAVDTTGKVVDATGEVGDTPGAATDTKREVVTATGEAIHAMLLVRSPFDVMRALVSLHTFEDMTEKASVLTRKLLSRFVHLPIVFPCMWMVSGLRPEAIFRSFGFDWAKLDRISPIFLDKLMMFIGLFRELHTRASSPIDTAELLFNFKDEKGLDAHLKEIADQPGYDALARSLRELYNELKDFRSSPEEDIRIFAKSKLLEQLQLDENEYAKKRPFMSDLFDDEKFWSFAGLKGPIDIKKFEDFLTFNRQDRVSPRVVEFYISQALVLVKGPADVAQALSSLYDLNFQKFDLLQLHNGLASLYSHLPGKLASVWMELGLDPQKIYEMLSLRYGAEYVTHLGCVVEWFKYVKLYSAVHSKCALGLEEAVKLLVLKQDTKASRA